MLDQSLAAITVGLAVLGWLQLLNPYTILVSMFLIGVGFAFNAPAWTSIVPQVVSDGELPSAATLSGLQLNISGIIGPVLGGLLVPLAGANFVFAVNAACFLLVVLAIRVARIDQIVERPADLFLRVQEQEPRRTTLDLLHLRLGRFFQRPNQSAFSLLNPALSLLWH